MNWYDERDRVLPYFFDFEFDEDGKTIEPISLGIVCADGREYYAISNEFDPEHCNDWVKANVLPHLSPRESPEWKSKTRIARDVLEFVNAGGKRPRFYAYYADYDWVAFCQLFGRMIDLPRGWPQYAVDLKQWSMMLSSPLHPSQQTKEHHALHDARWNRSLYDLLDRIDRKVRAPNIVAR